NLQLHMQEQEHEQLQEQLSPAARLGSKRSSRPAFSKTVPLESRIIATILLLVFISSPKSRRTSDMILSAPWLGEALSSAIVDIVLPSKGPNADPDITEQRCLKFDSNQV